MKLKSTIAFTMLLVGMSNFVQATCDSTIPRTSPSSNFATHADGTVTDTRTGLVWRRCPLGMNWNGNTCSGYPNAYDWQDALQTLQSINQGGGIAGMHDWRLPNVQELSTLLELACSSPAINAAIFPGSLTGAGNGEYWTSTPDGSDFVRFVDFDTGWGSSAQNYQGYRVRPVRGSQRGSGGGTTPPQTDFSETFDSLDDVNAHGWLVANVSEPAGAYGWFYGDDSVFPAQAGASTSLVEVNYQATADSGTISAWLLTPLLDFRPGSSVSFWTRTVTGAPFADRLQVRVCLGPSCNMVGPGALGVDNFESLLLDINPNLQAGADASGANGYPDHWTRFTLGTGDGVPSSGRGRIAFRYFVTNGGVNGTNSNLIGLDTVHITASPAE